MKYHTDLFELPFTIAKTGLHKSKKKKKKKTKDGFNKRPCPLFPRLLSDRGSNNRGRWRGPATQHA